MENGLKRIERSMDQDLGLDEAAADAHSGISPRGRRSRCWIQANHLTRSQTYLEKREKNWF